MPPSADKHTLIQTPVTMPSSPLRFGLIGTGIWVRNVHGPAAAKSEVIRFTGIFARNAATANEIASQYGVTAYSDLSCFLDNVDIVGIAVPPAAQPHFALAAIAAGKHVLLEKPVALDSQAAWQIVDGLEKKGLKSLVFFTNLFNPRVRAWIDDVHAVGGWSGGRIDTFSGVIVDPGNPFHTTLNWRGHAGALWDSVPHGVALLTQIFGPVVEVYAAGGSGDLGAATLIHCDGGLTTINFAMDMTPSVPGETAIYGAAGKRVMPAAVLDWNSTAREAYGAALRSLVATVNGEPTRYPDARFSAYVTDVLAAIENSRGSRTPIAVGR